MANATEYRMLQQKPVVTFVAGNFGGHKVFLEQKFD